MKKVFISVPMKGRKKEDIVDTILAVRRAYLVSPACENPREVEFLNTMVEEEPPYETNKEHTSVWYLGKSLEILSQADAMLCLTNTYDFSGCYIEREVAHRYGIKVYEFPMSLFAPDINGDRLAGESIPCEACPQEAEKHE